MPRYRFDDFVLSPRRRTLTRGGAPCPLIPRYFDLLVYLVERRGDAVPRQAIFDRVWRDVIVSDSALSQAVRTIRRSLGDDSREPRYLRTVSRHGYQFVFPAVIEEDDGGEIAAAAAPPSPVPPPDAVAALLARLTATPGTGVSDDDRRDAAEQLHALGTSAALAGLDGQPGQAQARALLRDSRWDVPGAGTVPILGAPAALATAWALTRLRLERAATLAGRRWAAAAFGGAAAGAVAGIAGGVLLALAPGSTATLSVVPLLAVFGAVSGHIGGAGVGAGLAMAESVLRSRRILGLTVGGALGGGGVGLAVQWLGRATLRALLGLDVPVGGGLDGLVLGAAAALGFAVATRRTSEGVASPRGTGRLVAVATTAAATAVAALALSASGRPLVGGTIHLIAQASTGAEVVLTPLGTLLGEPGFGPVTAALLGLGEGALFGAGLAIGLTHRD